MRCLITGGAGFIGSHLAELLLAEGHEVRILDDFSTGKPENLAAVAAKAEVIRGDMTDEGVLAQALKGMDRVFHFAALVSVPESIRHPQQCLTRNDKAVLSLFTLAREAGVKRLIYSSSAAVYGNQPVPHAESLCPDPTASPYGIHKLTGEHYGRFFYATYGLESVYLRYFNVFGPRQDPSSPYSGVISIFMDRLRRGEAVTIHGDGQQSRDFIHVADVARANLLAAEAPGCAGQAFNIATGHITTISQVHETIRQLAGSAIEPVYGPSRPGDILHSAATVDKARNMLGFSARVSFAEGMKSTWDWYLQSFTNTSGG